MLVGTTGTYFASVRRPAACLTCPGRRANSESPSSALVELAGLELHGDLFAAGLARDARGGLRGHAAEQRAELQRNGGDVDLAAVALDRAQRRRRDVLGRLRADAL